MLYVKYISIKKKRKGKEITREKRRVSKRGNTYPLWIIVENCMLEIIRQEGNQAWVIFACKSTFTRFIDMIQFEQEHSVLDHKEGSTPKN